LRWKKRACRHHRHHISWQKRFIKRDTGSFRVLIHHAALAFGFTRSAPTPKARNSSKGGIDEFWALQSAHGSETGAAALAFCKITMEAMPRIMHRQAGVKYAVDFDA
jgi:hypothetical protein